MNLLTIKDKSLEEIYEIFHIADRLKSNNELLLKGKTFVLFFPESSIRTRLTFEKGIQDLGGKCIIFPPSTLDKSESLIDVVSYIENWADGIIVRHSDYEKVCNLGLHANIPVINAMTSNNHPCEILSDLFSLSKLRKDFRSLTYTFVGGNGNISKSWTVAAEILNLKMNHVSNEANRIKENDENYYLSNSLNKVLQETDIVLTDSLPSNMKTPEYIKEHQITVNRMNKCKPNAILNPCPPFYRGEEVSGEVIDSEYFVGYEFKKNLIYVQQSIILHCLGIQNL